MRADALYRYGPAALTSITTVALNSPATADAMQPHTAKARLKKFSMGTRCIAGTATGGAALSFACAGTDTVAGTPF